MTATWPLLLPHHPDLLAAHVHPRLVRALTKNRSGTEPLLDAMGASRRSVGLPACSALALGMSARNAGERAHAVDALAELSRRDRLPGAELGRQLAALLDADAVTGSRVAAALTEAARITLPEPFVAAAAAKGTSVLQRACRRVPQ